MGSLIQARCPCGFEMRMALGGGMHNHETYCGFPALCPHCRAFDVVNLLEGERPCVRCRAAVPQSYDSPALRAQAGREEVFSWRMMERPEGRVTLTDGTYRCPRCDGTTLRFYESGFWD